MGQTLSDFSALKGLKKEMEKQEQAASPKPAIEQKKVRTVQHRTLEEEHALEYQMNWFRKLLRENLKYRGKRLIFIHGDGDGTLKAAVRKELDEVFAVSCSYTFGAAEQYGTGATVVTVK